MFNYIWSVWLAFLDKTNFIVTGLTVAFVWYTRSAGVLYFSIGAVLCSLAVKVVKRVVRQPRPPVNITGRKMKVSYGMPSTHSAAISYFATYILLASRYLPLHTSLQPAHAWRVFTPLICLPWATSVVMSRIWLGHHTWPQVFAGASFGVGLASIWYSLWVGGWNIVGAMGEEAWNEWLSAHNWV
ncbi:PAP2-domain-containing protein [Pholiota conissans]|uniref:PAP2-domain-containing protein n=1 Tax=Pholiota conissans TaxID=109636 RepID=A0A9P5ZB89_9AGAR|nr:PAP2-domain-containing protein [Pholiota conissans]